MPTLEALLTLRPVSDRSFSVDVPDGWQQGRGAFGGLVVGYLIRAATASRADASHLLRSISAELLAPVEVGDAALTADVLRIGQGTTTISVRLTQAGEVRAHAVAVFARARDPQVSWNEGKALAPWADATALPVAAPLGPVFAQHFEYRPTGAFPFSSGKDPVVSGWIRPHAPGDARDEAYLAACADAYWPTLFSVSDGPRPIATIAYTLQIVAALEHVPKDAPLYHEAISPASRDGYFVEYRTLRGEGGRIVALNQQTFVAIR